MLEARELLTVTYNGGALLTNVDAQAVYLGSAWNTDASLQSQTQQTDQFLSTLVSGSYMQMLSIYNVGTGTDTKGVVDAPSNLSSNSTLSDSQIQTDLAALINSGQAQAPNANNLYVVYVEPGVIVSDGSATSQNSFLGYHGAFNDVFNGKNTDIHYAVITYPGNPNPSAQSQGFQSSFDEQTSVTSHEVAEAVTDPNVNYKTLGWYDYQLNGEIGDLAEGHESTITDANGVQYVVQDVVNQSDQIISPGSGSTGGGTKTGGGTTTGGVGTLPSPTLQVSAVSSTVAQLKWNLVSGAAGYNIYLMNAGSEDYLGTVSASTSSVDVTGLKSGSSDSFMVEAANQAGAVGDSAVESVTLPTPVVPVAVTPPSSVTATPASSSSVVLSWKAEPQATGYNIYWSNGYQVEFLGTVSGSTSSVTVTGLRPGSSSYFLVEAFNNVSYADSHWVYTATPYASGGGAGYGWYAEQRSNGFFGGAPSMFANQSSGPAGRERY